MDAIIDLLKTNPLIALVVILLVGAVWLARQLIKSVESERTNAVKSATAIEATNIRLERIEEWVKPRQPYREGR